MRRNLIIVLALAAGAAMALGASAVFGSGASVDVRPDFASVEVQMTPTASPPNARQAKATKSRKPKVIYLAGSGSLNTGETGPYVDFELRAAKSQCPRVIDGGIRAGNLDFFEQGSYVDGGQYHVLMALDDAAAGTPVTIPYALHLICLKGVR